MFLKLLFFPPKSIAYFVAYFHVVEQIKLDHNQRYIRKVQLLNMLNLCTCLHFLYLGLFPLSRVERALHFDQSIFFIPWTKFIFLATLCFVTINMLDNHLLFIGVDFCLVSLLNQVLVRSRFPVGLVFYQKEVCVKFIRKCYLYSQNAFHLGVMSVGPFWFKKHFGRIIIV